ncbi:hypothetical protein ACVWXO_009517 [Bradyrhizobium sp. LM2.7]
MRGRASRSIARPWPIGSAAPPSLRPVHERLLARLKGSAKLFADETTAPVLDPGRGKTKTGQLWAYARDDRPWGWRRPARCGLCLRARSQGGAADCPSRWVHGHPSGRWLCRLSRTRRARRRATGILLGPCAPTLLRTRCGRPGADRQRGARMHRRALCHRERHPWQQRRGKARGSRGRLCGRARPQDTGLRESVSANHRSAWAPWPFPAGFAVDSIKNFQRRRRSFIRFRYRPTASTSNFVMATDSACLSFAITPTTSPSCWTWTTPLIERIGSRSTEASVAWICGLRGIRPCSMRCSAKSWMNAMPVSLFYAVFCRGLVPT